MALEGSLQSNTTANINKYSIDTRDGSYFISIKDADINNSDPGLIIGNPEEYTGSLIENDDDSWYEGY